MHKFQMDILDLLIQVKYMHAQLMQKNVWDQFQVYVIVDSLLKMELVNHVLMETILLLVLQINMR